MIRRRRTVIGSTYDPGADASHARRDQSAEGRLADRLTEIAKPRRVHGDIVAIDVRGTPFQVERERQTWVVRHQETDFVLRYLYPHQAADRVIDAFRRGPDASAVSLPCRREALADAIGRSASRRVE